MGSTEIYFSLLISTVVCFDATYGCNSFVIVVRMLTLSLLQPCSSV